MQAASRRVSRWGERLDVELPERGPCDEVSFVPKLVVDGDRIVTERDPLESLERHRSRDRFLEGAEDRRVHLQGQGTRSAPLRASPAVHHCRDHSNRLPRRRDRQRGARSPGRLAGRLTTAIED